MKNSNGLTVIELLVVLVIGGIMFLAVGAVSDIGKRSHRALLQEASLYNDITYGFKLIQDRVHTSRTISLETAASPWVGQKLIAGQEAFGVYHPNASPQDFVYLPDRSNDSDRRVILSVADGEALNAAFSIIGSKVTATLSGTKDAVPFSISTTVKSRRL